MIITYTEEKMHAYYHLIDIVANKLGFNNDAAAIVRGERGLFEAIRTYDASGVSFAQHAAPIVARFIIPPT